MAKKTTVTAKEKKIGLQSLANDPVQLLADTPLASIFREALSDVERDLALEDKGWITNLSGTNVIEGSERIGIINRARQCYHYYALAKQGIRLWVNYTFGTGISWTIVDIDENGKPIEDQESEASKIISEIWYGHNNESVFSAKGQYKSARKLLIDGEVFFALFVGADETNVRRIDPLEITEIITDKDDTENVLLYKREWTDSAGGSHTAYYPSITNLDRKPVKDSSGSQKSPDKNAPFVYHLPLDELGDRGVSILTPILDWLKLYRRYMASRVAVMLALARFAWKVKVKGGATAVASEKGKFNDTMYQAGSIRIENEGVDTTQIKTDSGGAAASEDGRQLKLLIANGFGIPEQYFCDISTGNLATAKTVELPMLKQFQTHQQLWGDAYRTIFEVILTIKDIDLDKINIDIDFPEIAPEDAVAAVTAINQAVMAFPEFASSPEVQKLTLMNLGLNNTDEILQALNAAVGEVGFSRMLEVITKMRESIEKELPCNVQNVKERGSKKKKAG